MYPIHGACTSCGCSLAECECAERAEPDVLDKIKRYFTTMEQPKDVYRCFDCLGKVSMYMVTDRIWDRAWPHHPQHHKIMLKMAQSMSFPDKLSSLTAAGHDSLVHQLLCFDCLSIRLGRPLLMEDFTASHQNKPIRLGFQMAMATLRPTYFSTEPPA